MERLCRRLDYVFKDEAHLIQALTHRSASSKNNERLEFLGDSILGYTIAEALYHKFPKADEGQLSRLRASLVRCETLAEIARELNLGKSLILGIGELKSGGHNRASILEDAMEALFGAIFLESGELAAKQVILNLFAKRLNKLTIDDVQKDPKTQLQETLQSFGRALPQYDVLEITGAAHDQTFRVSCRLEDEDLMVEGVGSSRRKAEQAAAKSILEQIQNAG